VLKKTLAHILLVVFIIQLFGMSVMYYSQRYSFKQSAINVIESNKEAQFTFLKLTTLEFQLAKFDEHELFVNGMLFDIIEKESENGYINVKVFRDVKEESFLKKTIDWFDATNSGKSSLPKLILKTFFNPSVITENLNSYFIPSVIITLNRNLLFQFLNVFITPLTPPPLVS
jgi:hypothetical protein